MAFDYAPYMRMAKLPHLWCPGCGIGIIVKSMIRAIDRLGWAKDDIAVVSGIGCTSRAPGYLDMNTLHTTHGRALSFATGIKLVRPEKHVIVIAGDGDMSAIGGNHLIHACRRNIDITCIIVNNNIYGMTGGQYSPTTPQGARAATAPWGNMDPCFDLTDLAKGAGATYVARGQVANGIQLEKLIRDGLAHHGFAVIDALSNCHTQFGRRNKLPDPMQLIRHIQETTVPMARAAKMSSQELEGKFVVGELYRNTDRPEFCDECEKLRQRVQAIVSKQKAAAPAA
jgi:2-oxoglutarate ferredoxin oxidoreductase subunit beta